MKASISTTILFLSAVAVSASASNDQLVDTGNLRILKASKSPKATKDPAMTKSPKATKDPAATKSPKATKDPAATKSPKATKDPAATKSPKIGRASCRERV